MNVSVILPTYNERENLPTAVARLHQALAACGPYEIVVVDDDSPDRTWELAQALGETDPRIRCYRRTDRRGLSSAIVDGLNLATGRLLVVMDADLQHDTAVVPQLLQALDDAPVAVATRYAPGGGTGRWSKRRRLASTLATAACNLVLGVRTTDPMSGFFALRRPDFLAIVPRLNPRGYKILMELLHVLRPARIGEVPYHFAPRSAGESKLSGQVVWDFALSLAELATRRLVSARFLKYGLVGGSGVVVQFGSFFLLWGRLASEHAATACAIATAAVSNYVINNLWTFRDRAHSGVGNVMRGLGMFLLVSGTGAMINHALTFYYHEQFAAPLWLAMAGGIAISTAWNYFLNRDLSWSGHAHPE